MQQLVDKQLKALQVTIFDKHFKELKDRVDRIDCSVKHQPAITALQVSSHSHWLHLSFRRLNVDYARVRKIIFCTSVSACLSWPLCLICLGKNRQASKKIWRGKSGNGEQKETRSKKLFFYLAKTCDIWRPVFQQGYVGEELSYNMLSVSTGSCCSCGSQNCCSSCHDTSSTVSVFISKIVVGFLWSWCFLLTISCLVI